MSIKVESYGTQGRYMVGAEGFSLPKYSVSRENVKKFAEEYDSINTLKTAQNAAITGILGTLSIFAAAKFGKKIPLIARIPLAFLAFCAASMTAYVSHNWFAGKKIEEIAKKYGAERISTKNSDKKA